LNVGTPSSEQVRLSSVNRIADHPASTVAVEDLTGFRAVERGRSAEPVSSLNSRRATEPAEVAARPTLWLTMVEAAPNHRALYRHVLASSSRSRCRCLHIDRSCDLWRLYHSRRGALQAVAGMAGAGGRSTCVYGIPRVHRIDRVGRMAPSPDRLRGTGETFRHLRRPTPADALDHRCHQDSVWPQGC
jgi:hypothetical protein